MIPADQLIEKALSLFDCDQAQVIVQDSYTLNLRWANNTPTTNGVTRSREIVLIAHDGKRVGTTTHSDLGLAGLQQAVKTTMLAARSALPAEDYSELPNAWESMGADWADAPAAVGPETLRTFCVELKKSIAQAQKLELLLFGYAEQVTSTVYLGTSTGLRTRYVQPRGQLEMTAKSLDYSRSVWAGAARTDLGHIDLDSMTKGLFQRLEWSKTQIELPAGNYQTILQPSAVADMMVYAYWTAAARDADEGRTVFSAPGGSNRIGQKLAHENISLYSDPAEPGLSAPGVSVTGSSSSMGSVFDNGMSIERTDWIRDGVLVDLIRPSYWAKKTTTRARPFVENLIMPGTGPSLEDIIASTKRGLLVTCLWYIREVDPSRLLLTGLTRDGVFLVEDGQVVGEVNNFRFNMSPVEMLNQVSTVGQSEKTLAREFGDYFSFTKMPAIVVDDFTMSSVSKAR
jgi:predicted Zn-dependent protease